jgi:anti-anti-sigma regulatory factor
MWPPNCFNVGAMLKIRRSDDNGHAIFALSGRIEERNISELQELFDAEEEPEEVTLDLTEVKLVDREAIRFLADCKARGVRLKDCPSYIRRWIEQGSD